MATPVLPYPDMDFTPLDILTAEEMNQLVANDQYLKDFAAGLADGTNLGNGVVKQSNVILNFGQYKIMTGQTTITSVQTGQDKTCDVTFPEAFNNIPTVVATANIWISSPDVMVISVSKTGFRLVCHHLQGTTNDVPIYWIAIG